MDIQLLVGLFPKELEDEIVKNSIGGVQNAANNLQWEIVSGFEENLGKPINVLNSKYIGSYPFRYKKIIIPTYKFSSLSGNSKYTNVGFLNLSVMKSISKLISLKPFINKWIKNKSASKKIIIAYAMTGVFVQLLKYSKLIDKNVITCLIIPDLPKYMNLSGQKNIVYRLLKSLEIKLIEKNMKYIDCYVVLTSHMIEALSIDKPFVVVEGMSPSLLDFEPAKKSPFTENLKTVLYTGGLNKEYGVLNLVREFKLLKNRNYRLILCGSGNDENMIKELCKEDDRIIFKGYLKRNEILSLQKEATVLINPRDDTSEFTKYSFPSKLLEYMSSGRPVISYMLAGIPNEYRDFLYLIDENIENPIFNTLEKVLKMDENELSLMGEKSRNFVVVDKNRNQQCKKIIMMLNNL